jgi:integrase
LQPPRALYTKSLPAKKGKVMRQDAISPPSEKTKQKKGSPTKHKRPAGQIIKRGAETFLVRVYLHQDANGKRTYYNATVKGTRKDAEQYLTDYLQKKHVGKLRQRPSDKRFEDFLKDYFDNISTARRRNREIDMQKVRLYILPTLGHLRLKDITSLHLENLYRQLRNTVSERTGNPLSGTTRNHVHRILVNALGYAVKRRLLIDSPLTGIVAPKPDSKEMNTLSPDEVIKFLKACDDNRSNRLSSHKNRVGPMFHLAIETGMRPEEYFALKWSDIDFGDPRRNILPTLRVNRVAIRLANKNDWWFDEPKTARSRRSIPLSDELVTRLKVHRKQVERWKLEAKDWEDHDLVFPNNNGTPHYPCAIRTLFKKVLEAAGIDSSRYRQYDLRHSCASLLLRANVHPKVVSERMGHSSVTITLDVYSHCVPTMQESATLSISGMIYKAEEESEAQGRATSVDVVLTTEAAQ